MKLIYLILKNISNTVTQKKFTCFIVVFSSAVISYGILFYAGYLFYSYYDKVGDEVDKLNITLEKNVDTKDIQDILNKLTTNDATNSIIVSEEEYDRMDGRVIGAYHENYQERMMAGQYYTKTDCESKMILPEYMVEELIGSGKNPIGKSVKIEDQNFVIAGVVSYFQVDGYEVPVTYYLENYKVSYIRINYSKSLSSAEKDTFQNVLSQNENVKEYTVECNKPALLSFRFWIDFIQIFIIFLLMIFNLFFILVFWIKSQRRKYNIYSVLGCSKGKLVMIMVLQNSIILLLGNIIGFFVFVLTFPVLTKLNLIYGLELTNYAIVHVLFYLVTIVALTVLIFDNNENTMYIMKE